MTQWKSSVFLAAAAVFAIATAVASEQYTTLEEMGQKLKIDAKQISVSGISSGGFMAHQFHVAHSGNLMGAGIIAGGPYYCARGDVYKGMQECTAFLSEEGCKICAGLYCDLCKKWSYRGPGSAPPGKEASDAAILMAENSIAATLNGGDGIDDPGGLLHDKVILIHGIRDTLLPVGVMDALDRYYQGINVRLGRPPKTDDLVYLKTLPIAHAVPTDNAIGLPAGKVGACGAFGSPFLNVCTPQECAETCPKDPAPTRCDNPSDAAFASCIRRDSSCLRECMATINTAGAILKHIYGSLKPRCDGDGDSTIPPCDAIRVKDWGKFMIPPTVEQNCRKGNRFDQRCQWLRARLFAIDQSEVARNAKDLGDRYLSRKGFLFVPPQCTDGRKCKLHVAFHGCLQGYGLQGHLIEQAIYSMGWTHFVENAGYNEWANTNDIVVLYPQASTGLLTVDIQHVNPQGCWDFWGYTDPKYPTKDGKQIAAVWNMIELLVPDLRK